MNSPLIWNTRDEPEDGALTTALRGVGLATIAEPVVSRSAVQQLPDELFSLQPGDWLVLTSAFAASVVPTDSLRTCHVAVVGAATRRAVETRGGACSLQGPGPGVDALLAALRNMSPKGRVLYARSNLARLPKDHGFHTLDAPVVYVTAPIPFNGDRVAMADVIAVTSPSAVAVLKDDERPFASLGPTTSDALRLHGRHLWLESPTPSFGALAQAISERHQRA